MQVAIRSFVIFGAIVVSLAHVAAAADLPLKLTPPATTSWPSFRNGNEQLGVASSTLPDKLELLWKYEAGDIIMSTAAIVGDYVYCASLKGELFCLDRKTGVRLWSYHSKDTTDPKAFLPGFKSSPTVTADAVYLGDEDGVFHAVDRATGKQRWTFPTGGEIVSSASIVKGRLIFGSHDNSLYCLNMDGSKAWQYVTEGMVNCSPAISGDYTFVTGCDEHLRVIDINTGKQHADMPLGTYLIASPAVLDNMLYVGTYASEVIAIDWKLKQKIWTYKDPTREFPYHSSAAVNEQFVVVGGQDKRVHCMDRKTGKKAWIFTAKAKIVSSPVIVGDRVFIGSNDGNVYGLSLKDGQEFWRHPLGSPISASPAVGEGCLVIGAESSAGTILCFGKKSG